MKILHVVGTRPNFVKVAPIISAMKKCPQIEQKLISTGQHYSYDMAGVFFDQLQIPSPDYTLSAQPNTVIEQISQIMRWLEPILNSEKPDWVFVIGDVNSTLAAALTCAKIGINVAHVESGLRSFDKSMPEEINRIVTDHVAGLHFTSCEDGNENLLIENINPSTIHHVGNVMIDALMMALPLINPSEHISDLTSGKYILATLHRPSNVDNPERLASIMDELDKISKEIRAVFPAHPRTQKMMGVIKPALTKHFEIIPPLSYLDFLAVERSASVVITDSGGVQEETTWLGVPCLTLRPNTERPITISMGTNKLTTVEGLAEDVISHRPSQKPQIPLWDGHSADRIVDTMLALSN